jgi:hypothetical protein
MEPCQWLPSSLGRRLVLLYEAQMLVRKRCDPAQGAQRILLPFPFPLTASTAVCPVKRAISLPALMKYSLCLWPRTWHILEESPEDIRTSTYGCPSYSFGKLPTRFRCSVEVAKLPRVTYGGACWHDGAGWVRTGGSGESLTTSSRWFSRSARGYGRRCALGGEGFMAVSLCSC